MDIIFEESSASLPILYDALNAQQQILIETAQMLYQCQRSGDVEILTEGFGDIIQKIIDKIVDIIKKIRQAISQCLMRLNSRAMSYKKIMDKYAPELRDTNVMPFEVDGYDFTITGNSNPDISQVYAMYAKYNDTLMSFNKLSSDKVREICEEITGERELSDIRGRILGTNKPVGQATVKQEAFKFYRDGKSETTTLTVSSETIKDIIANYENIIDARKVAISNNKEVNRLLNDMERYFKVVIPKKLKETQSMSDLKYGDLMTQDDNPDKIANIADFNAYVNAKYKQTVEIAHAVTAIYTEHIAAIDSKMKQDEFIVRKALDRAGQHLMESIFATFDKYNSYPATPNKNWAEVWEGCNLIGGGYNV